MVHFGEVFAAPLPTGQHLRWWTEKSWCPTDRETSPGSFLLESNTGSGVILGGTERQGSMPGSSQGTLQSLHLLQIVEGDHKAGQDCLPPAHGKGPFFFLGYPENTARLQESPIKRL